jgi:hypothetical protein
MASGIYNPWIEKSLARLATLMPGRYAKPEESSGPLASLETFTYRVPGYVPVQTSTAEASPSTIPSATPSASAQEQNAVLQTETTLSPPPEDALPPEASPAEAPSAPEADAFPASLDSSAAAAESESVPSNGQQEESVDAGQ